MEEVCLLIYGFSLFYIDFDCIWIKVYEIEKMGCKIVDFNELFFEDFEILMEDWIGEEGKGFEYIFEGMNFEWIFIVVEVVGFGKFVLLWVIEYVKMCIVFN